MVLFVLYNGKIKKKKLAAHPEGGFLHRKGSRRGLAGQKGPYSTVFS